MTPIQFHTGQEPTIKEKVSDGKTEEMHLYDCPFCGKEQHLYYFPSNTVYDCKVCGKKGNVHTFNQSIYGTSAHEIDYLVDNFDLPKRVFESIRYNELNNSFLFPTYHNGRLNNLYKYIPSQNKFYGTPGLPATLMDWEDDSHEEIWICEGQKDKLAADAIVGMGKEITPVCLPGANMIKDSFMGAFVGKHILLLFDNDDAGKSGKEKTLELFRRSHNKPKSVKEVIWPDTFPEKGDLRDFYHEHRGSSYANLQPLIHPIQDEATTKVTTDTILEDPSCDTYSKAIEYFQEAFHLTEDMEAVLAMVMASIYSLNVEGEQLWLKVIGSPGCGKTRIAKAVSASEHVTNMSTFTGLFSGWQDGKEDDPSMIPRISGKTLIIKDADALMKQPNIEKIMSELRDFYDKDSNVSYRNRKSYSYQNVRSTFIMLGTQVLRRADQSFLGERLLTIEMNVNEKDEALISNMMMQRSLDVAMGKKEDPETKIMATMKGWLNHLRDRPLDSSLPQEYQKELLEMCRLTAQLRTQVDRASNGRLLSPAVPELPTRLIGQSISASLSLCAVFGINYPSEKVYQYVRKVLRDTMNPRSHRFFLCDIILEHPGITAAELIAISKFDKEIVGQEIRDMTELNLLKIKASAASGGVHRGYTLRDNIAKPLHGITNG